MENQANSKSIILNYGLYLGVAGILVNVIVYAMGAHLDPHWSVSLAQGVFLVGLIVLGIKKYKEANGGFLSWGQGVKVGVGIAIIAGLIGAIYNYIFMNFIEPEFMTQLMEVQNQKLLDQGLTEEQIEASNEMGKAFQGPLIMSAFAIIGSAIVGFIISAIAAAVMKKSEEETY